MNCCESGASDHNVDLMGLTPIQKDKRSLHSTRTDLGGIHLSHLESVGWADGLMYVSGLQVHFCPISRLRDGGTRISLLDAWLWGGFLVFLEIRKSGN